MRDASPFLLLGLILAGILHILVPSKIIEWAVGAKGFRGAVRGALLGAPLPLCSCSVMPTTMALRRRGASLSSSFSFLISTPETSVDAVAVTAALLPSAFLGIRPIAAIATSILVGMLIERMGTSAQRNFERKLESFSGVRPVLGDDETCRICGLEGSRHEHTKMSRVSAVVRYAFDEFFEDIGFWVIGGLFASALVSVLLPDGFLAHGFWRDHQTLQIIFAVAISIPIYSCATASTPMAAALLAKGLSPGAGLALLIAGPATNLGSLLLITREFGKRVVTAYLFGMTACCLVFGYALNAFWPRIAAHPKLLAPFSSASGGWFCCLPGWIEVSSAWIVLALVARIVVKKFRQSDEDCCDHDHDHGHDHGHTHG